MEVIFSLKSLYSIMCVCSGVDYRLLSTPATPAALSRFVLVNNIAVFSWRVLVMLLLWWWWYYSAITTTHPSSLLHLLILCQRNCDPAVESRIPQLFPDFHFSSQTTLKYQFPLNGYCAAKRDFKCCSSPPPHNACHSFVPSSFVLFAFV